MNKLDIFEDVEPIVEAIQRVEDDLKDYPWILDKVQNYQREQKLELSFSNMPAAKTVNYGIEASMPNAPYGKSDPTFREAKKNLRVWERHKRYLDKIELLEQAVADLPNERERLVIEGVLDKHKAHEIAQELNVSRQTVQEIKRSAIRHLAAKLYL